MLQPMVASCARNWTRKKHEEQAPRETSANGAHTNTVRWPRKQSECAASLLCRASENQRTRSDNRRAPRYWASRCGRAQELERRWSTSKDCGRVVRDKNVTDDALARVRVRAKTAAQARLRISKVIQACDTRPATHWARERELLGGGRRWRSRIRWPRWAHETQQRAPQLPRHRTGAAHLRTGWTIFKEVIGHLSGARDKDTSTTSQASPNLLDSRTEISCTEDDASATRTFRHDGCSCLTSASLHIGWRVAAQTDTRHPLTERLAEREPSNFKNLAGLSSDHQESCWSRARGRQRPTTCTNANSGNYETGREDNEQR